MGFFFTEEKTSKKASKIPVHTARELECKVCPLEKVKNYNPKMKPEGSKEPLLYILRNFPTIEDDKEGEYLTDRAGQLLLANIPSEWDEVIRTNGILRCFPENKVTDIALECCKKSVVTDIENTKPFLVLGLGAEVLRWVTGVAGIYAWRGRFLPVKIGAHTCWFYCSYDPEEILHKRRNRKDRQGNVTETKSEWDGMFVQDIHRVLDMLEEDVLPDPKVVEKDYLKNVKWVEGKKKGDFEKVIGWLDKLESEPIVGIDIETNCIRPYEMDSLLITVSIGTMDNTVAFPLEHPEAKWTPKQVKKLKEALKEFICNSGTKVAHSLGFEQEWFAYKLGKSVLHKDVKWGDTMAQSYILDERKRMHKLDTCVRIAFGFDLKALSNIDRTRMMDYKLKEVLPYNGLDTKWTYGLHFKQQARLEKEPNLMKVHKQLIRSMPTLVTAQMTGLCVDWKLHKKYNVSMQEEMASLIKEIQKTKEVTEYQNKYGTFNPDAPMDLLKLLQRVCGLDEELKDRKKKNKYSTGAPILHALREDIPLAGYILDYRSLAKKHANWIEPLRKHVFESDDRIHTNYNLYVTTTGRLSSNEPNMQNWPQRKGKEIRRLIVAPENHWMVAADYGQIEARILGVVSQDKVFCEAMWHDYDVHLEWAERIARAYPQVIGGRENLENKKKLMSFRKDIKNQWVFPAFYGSSIYSIAAGVGIPIDIAKDLFRDFWATFKGVKAWQKRTLEFYNKHGYVQTLTGRRRRAPLGYNESINSGIQGTASDICVNAMNALVEADRDYIQVVMNIHDDVTSYVPDNMLEQGIDEIAEIMCTAANDLIPEINVPIAVEVTAGENWCDQEIIGTYKSTDFIHVDSTLFNPEIFMRV